MITLILVILASIFKAIIDTLQFHYTGSPFDKGNAGFWNPAISWRNKYKNHDPAQGPKFFGSTTFLVWLTDAWHLFQMVFLNTILTAIVFYKPYCNHLIDFLLLAIIFKTIFQLIYSNMYKK